MDPKAVKYHSRILKNILKDPRNIELLESLGSASDNYNFQFLLWTVVVLWGEDNASDFSIELRENDVHFACLSADQEQGQLIANCTNGFGSERIWKRKK